MRVTSQLTPVGLRDSQITALPCILDSSHKLGVGLSKRTPCFCLGNRIVSSSLTNRRTQWTFGNAKMKIEESDEFMVGYILFLWLFYLAYCILASSSFWRHLLCHHIYAMWICTRASNNKRYALRIFFISLIFMAVNSQASLVSRDSSSLFHFHFQHFSVESVDGLGVLIS